jgi:hypothetical protein
MRNDMSGYHGDHDLLSSTRLVLLLRFPRPRAEGGSRGGGRQCVTNSRSRSVSSTIMVVVAPSHHDYHPNVTLGRLLPTRP